MSLHSSNNFDQSNKYNMSGSYEDKDKYIKTLQRQNDDLMKLKSISEEEHFRYEKLAND